MEVNNLSTMLGGFNMMVTPKLRNRLCLLMLILFCLLSISLLGGISPAEETGNILPDNPTEGFSLFVSKNCIRCHSIKGEGGRIAPDLGKIKLKGTLLDIAGIMWNHVFFMVESMKEERVAWPMLSSNEMAKLIDYLYYVGYFDEPGDPSHGEKMFDEKGCIKCHMVDGKGGDIGPSLNKFKKDYSPIFMIQDMWNHGAQMSSIIKDMGIERPAFEGDELIDISAFIRREARGEERKTGYLSPGNPREGKLLFDKKKCIRCHAIKGKGGKIGPDLGKISEKLHTSLTKVAGLMWNHWPAMQTKMEELDIVTPIFSGKEMADIISYLYYVGYFNKQGEIAEGKRLFTEMNCIKCHSFEDKKGVGPDLRKLPRSNASIEIATKMWNHAPIMKGKMKEMNVSWPLLERGDMEHLIEYVRSLNGKK